MSAGDPLDEHALSAGDVVRVELTTSRQQIIEGTVTGATAYVLIVARGTGVVSRIPWPSVLTIDTVGTAGHPATA